MILTIILIILFLFAAVVAFGYRQHYLQAKELLECNTELLMRYEKACYSRDAKYNTGRIPPLAEFDRNLWGRWAVVRTLSIDGAYVDSLVKAFTDDDEDFNQREAEDLRDKLNEL